MVRYASTLLVAAAPCCCWAALPCNRRWPKVLPDRTTCFTTITCRPGSPAGVAAAMYPCPRPTPPLVGHTYVTYQPLLPQEFLYQHELHYRTCYPDGSRTRTTVTYNHRSKLWPFQPSVMWSVATPHTPTVKVSCIP